MVFNAQMVENSIAKFSRQPQFVSWYAQQKPHEDDLIVINNSFVFRDVDTTKARYHLVLKAGPSNKPKRDLYVADGFKINSDFKLFPSKQPRLPPLVPIAKAISDQVKNIGYVVFALIGTINEDLNVEIPFSQAGYTVVSLRPSQTDLLSVRGSQITVRNTSNEEALWKELTKSAKALSQDALEKLRAEFGEALDKLQSAATARLSIPRRGASVAKGMTDTIIDFLHAHRKDYKAALNQSKGDPKNDREAFNEVLRIAYNFASDASTFLRLVVSICDLKPIVLWATIAEHLELSEAFRALPWSRAKNKPSLKNYISTVADVRNSAFHNIFPFRKALSLSLPASAFQNSELVFFSEYAPRKNMNRLTFEDKALVDVLMEFTRARQRDVLPDFWFKNVQVMDCTIQLFDATNQALKALHKARS